jgi:hypothetical protein
VGKDLGVRTPRPSRRPPGARNDRFIIGAHDATLDQEATMDRRTGEVLGEVGGVGAAVASTMMDADFRRNVGRATRGLVALSPIWLGIAAVVWLFLQVLGVMVLDRDAAVAMLLGKGVPFTLSIVLVPSLALLGLAVWLRRAGCVRRPVFVLLALSSLAPFAWVEANGRLLSEAAWLSANPGRDHVLAELCPLALDAGGRWSPPKWGRIETPLQMRLHGLTVHRCADYLPVATVDAHCRDAFSTSLSTMRTLSGDDAGTCKAAASRLLGGGRTWRGPVPRDSDADLPAMRAALAPR